MFTVDPLHEIDGGTFKDILTWIIRVLYFYGADKVQTLNQRYGFIVSF
jgi:hypothetical protein